MKKYPKIGIRPTIDGRQGGVRESLEEKTMNPECLWNISSLLIQERGWPRPFGLKISPLGRRLKKQGLD